MRFPKLVVLLLAVLTIAPAASAQTAPTPDLSAILDRLAALEQAQATQTALLQQLLAGLASTNATLQNSTAALLAQNEARLNATLALRFAAIDLAIEKMLAEGANGTTNLTMLRTQFANDSLAIMALLTSTGSQLDNATITLQTAGAQVGGTSAMLGRIEANLSLLDQHQTSDHLKLFAGTYITDLNDPNYNRPAYVALGANQRTLLGAQDALRNETATRDEAHAHAIMDIAHNLAAGFQTTTEKQEETSAKVQEAQSHASRARIYALVVLVILAGVLLYALYPRLASVLPKRRKRSDAGLETAYEAPPSEEEVALLTQEARQRARDVRPEPEPEPRPEETLPGVAPRRRRPSFGGA